MRFHEFGGPEVLRLEEVEIPVPGPGEVRLRVAATSFTALDARIRAGHTALPVQLPHTPGVDVAGMVDALGDGVDSVAVGDRVVGLLPLSAPGAAAEFVIAPADVLTGAPRNRPLSDMAALPFAGLSAWQAVFGHGHGRPRAGQRVLIHGADGAAGGYAVQLAKELRAHVIATATPGGAGRVRAGGADEVLVLPLDDAGGTGSETVHAVLDLAPTTPHMTDAPGPLGRHLTDVSGLFECSLAPRNDSDQLADLVARVCTGELIIDVARRVPLTDLPAVHTRHAAGCVPGTTVVLVSPA
ncbi:NADP-dependent oxidoreductase [Kineosporia succinea]